MRRKLFLVAGPALMGALAFSSIGVAQASAAPNPGHVQSAVARVLPQDRDDHGWGNRGGRGDHNGWGNRGGWGDHDGWGNRGGWGDHDGWGNRGGWGDRGGWGGRPGR